MSQHRVPPEQEIDIEQILRDNPELRAEWERMAPIHELMRLRIERGLSQAELAERAGTTQSAISRLEAGHVQPSLDTLRRLAAALDARVEVHIRPCEATAAA